MTSRILALFALIICSAVALAAEQQQSDYGMAAIDHQTRVLFGRGHYELYFKRDTVQVLEPAGELPGGEARQIKHVVLADVMIVPLLEKEKLITEVSENLKQFLDPSAIPVPDQMEQHSEEITTETRGIMLGHLARMVVTQTFGENIQSGVPVVRTGVQLPIYEDKSSNQRYILVFNTPIFLEE